MGYGIGKCIDRTAKRDQMLFLVVMIVAYMVITMTTCTLIGAAAEYGFGENDYGYQEYLDTTTDADPMTQDKWMEGVTNADKAKAIFSSGAVKCSAAAGAVVGSTFAILRLLWSGKNYIGYTTDKQNNKHFAALSRGTNTDFDRFWDKEYDAHKQNKKNAVYDGGMRPVMKDMEIETDQKTKMKVTGLMYGATLRSKHSFRAYTVIAFLFAALMALSYTGLLEYHQVMGLMGFAGVAGMGYIGYLSVIYSPTVARAIHLPELGQAAVDVTVAAGRGIKKCAKAVANTDLMVAVGDNVASATRYVWACTETAASAIGEGACAFGEGVAYVGGGICKGIGAMLEGNRRRRLKSVQTQSNDFKTSKIMKRLEDAIRQN